MKNLALAKLQALSLANTLPHAWLLLGADYRQKLQTAYDFSKWQLCLNKQDLTACSDCKSCHLFTAGTHPDFLVLSPAEDKTNISVDDIRSTIQLATSKPQLSAQKIILIYPAQAMQTSAANALLKMLEEPNSNTLFFLLCKHQNLLLKTIVSRCQSLNFFAPLAIDTAKLQQLLEDLRLIFIEKNTTSVQVVESWLKNWPQEILNYLEVVLMDLLRFKYTHNLELLTINNQIYRELSCIISIAKILDLLTRLQQAKYWLGNNYKLNQQLILEDLLLTV